MQYLNLLRENEVRGFCEEFRLDYQIINPQFQFLSQREYHFERLLGSSEFGFVISAFSEQKNLKVAIKSIRISDQLRQCMKEVTVLERLKESEFLQIQEQIYADELNTVFLISELCDSNLDDILKINKLNKLQIYAMTIQLLSGLSYLHNQNIGITHYSVKPSNILYNSKSNEFKLVDIGISKVFQYPNFNGTQSGTQQSTNQYISNEVLNQIKPYTDKEDIYSLGIVLLEIVIGQTLSKHEQELIAKGRETNIITNDHAYYNYFEEILSKMIISADDRLTSSKLLEKMLNLFSREQLITLTIPTFKPTKPFNFQEEKLEKPSIKQANESEKVEETQQEIIQKNLSSRKEQIVLEERRASEIKIEQEKLLLLQVQDLKETYSLKEVKLDAKRLILKFEAKGLNSEDGNSSKLIQFLNCFTDRKVLQLDISNQNIGAYVIEQIAQCLRNYSELEELNLDFSNNEFISIIGALKLSEGLKEFKNLKKLSLNLQNCNIGEQGANNLINCIKLHQYINQLSLNLQNNNISDLSVELLSEYLIDSQHLIYLQLNFFNNNITTIGAQKLAISLKKLLHLEALILGFNANRIGAYGSIELAKSFQFCQKLQFLQLRISYNNIGNDGVYKFAQQLKFNQLLKTFQLFISNENIDDECLTKLSKIYLDNHYLENIYINLSNNKIQDLGARMFVQSLKDHSTVKNIYLNLKENHITDQTKEQLEELMNGQKILL